MLPARTCGHRPREKSDLAAPSRALGTGRFSPPPPRRRQRRKRRYALRARFRLRRPRRAHRRRLARPHLETHFAKLSGTPRPPRRRRRAARDEKARTQARPPLGQALAGGGLIPMSDSAALNHAARIVALASREQPADAVLRDYLVDPTRTRMAPSEKRAVVRAVFTYFRWLQWLEPRDSLQKQFSHALTLQQRFDDNPASIKAEALAVRAVPPWLRDEMELPA